MKTKRLSLEDFKSNHALKNQQNLMHNIRGGEEDKKEQDTKSEEKTGPHMLVKGEPTLKFF